MEKLNECLKVKLEEVDKFERKGTKNQTSDEK